MATDQATVDWILDQLAPLPVRARKMFGEYGVYLGEQFVALICDDTLFIKPSRAGAEFADESWLGPPYPNAKPHHAIPEERIEDGPWLREFLEATAAALPPPKPKRPRKRPAASAPGDVKNT